MKFQPLDFRTNYILGFGQARKAPPPHLFFKTLEPIGTTEPRVGGYISNHCPAENLMDRRLVAERDLFEPVHQITQMILANL